MNEYHSRGSRFREACLVSRVASAQWHLLHMSGNALAAGERGKDLQIRHRRLAPCRSQI